MPRYVARAAFVAATLLTTACTQPAAMVQMEGHKFFAKSGAQDMPYTAYAPSAGNVRAPSRYTAPISMATTQAAPADSISVSNLDAPSPVQSADLAPPKAVAKAEPVKTVSAPEQKTAAVQKINPWTKKERTEFVETSSTKPVAKLDSALGAAKPEPVKAASTAKTKPVRLSSDASHGALIWPVNALIWPVNGNKIISSYGPKGGGKANDGINIAAASGEPVWAAADGEIVYVGNELQGYGNMVLIKHQGGKSTTYAHLSQITVDKYDRVSQGDIIGYVGSSGNVKKPQLHFAVRDGKDFVDPMKVVSRSVASN